MPTLEEAQELGKFGFWEFDLVNDTLFWSSQVYSIFDRDPNEFKPSYETFLSTIHPEDVDELKNSYEESLKNKSPYVIQHRILLPNDEVRYVIEKCETTYDSDGNALKSIGTVQDVTEKVKIRKRLEELEYKFQAISNQTTEGITVADMEGNYVFVNPAFCKMSGYTEKELLKMTVFDMKAPDQDHSSFKDSKEKLEGKPMRVNLQRKDGTKYITEIIGDVIMVDGEQLVLGTIRDITDRENREQEILALNNNLESLVKKRTMQLNETVESLNNEIEQRKLAEEQIKDSLEVKEILLKEITHRVKNNLQIISSLINLQKHHKNLSSTEELDQVAHRIQSMALIHETLYKSNEFEKVNFEDYVKSLIDYIQDAFSTAHLKFEVNIGSCEIPLDTATNCGMIVMELVTNSIKYAYPNKENGHIIVELEPLEDHVNILRIQDDGIGYPKGVDFRNTSSLGMQLVMSLTEQLDGRIDMKRGQGTTFEITLPCPV